MITNHTIRSRIEMVPEFYYEDYSRQFRLLKKECTGGIVLMTKMKWPERTIREETNQFKSSSNYR